MSKETIIKHPDPSKIHASFVETVNRSTSLAVVDAATYKESGELMRALKGAINILEKGDATCDWEGFDAPVKAAHDAHKFLVKVRDMATGPYKTAYALQNSRALGYETEQRRKAEEDARKAQEASRKAEEERQLLDAIQAEESGDKKAAEEIMAAPLVAPVIVPVPQGLPKIEGRSVRDNYSAECTDLMSLLRHIVAHPEDLSLVEVNGPAINARARSQRDGFSLPGCRLVKTAVSSLRAI